MGFFSNGKDKDFEFRMTKLESNFTAHLLNFESVVAVHKETQRLFLELQDSVIKLSNIQAQHKRMIVFLVNNAIINENANDEFQKILEEISAMGNEIKKT